MKRSIFIAVLGMGVAIAAHGQGKILFSNYVGSSGPTVNYAASNVPNGKAGQTIGSSFSAALLYYVGTSALDIPTQSSQLIAYGAPFAAFGTSIGGSGVDNAQYSGFFRGGVVTIPGVNGGNNTFVSFEVEAFNGASYANSTVEGISAIFQAAPSASSGSPTPNMAAFVPSFTVANVPEPTTLALAGLSGLASLVMLRRKKA